MSKYGAEIMGPEDALATFEVQMDTVKKVTGNVLSDDEKFAGKCVPPALELLVALCRASCEFDGSLAKQVSVPCFICCNKRFIRTLDQNQVFLRFRPTIGSSTCSKNLGVALMLPE